MSMHVFDRTLVRRRRDRAAAGFDAHDFLCRDVAERLADRLDDLDRAFPLALELGCRTGLLADALAGHGGIETLIQGELSEGMARRAAARPHGGGPRTVAMVADEESLPFAPATFDLVVSNLSLHWVNDLPGALVQARRVLKPDGLFLAAMAGGATLFELRAALAEAEIAAEGGLSPRVSPMADVRDAGNLLQRAGFALPVTDRDTITVTYPDLFGLLADLRGMGETNAVLERRRAPLRRATLMDAAMRYRDRHGGADGRLPATVEVIYLTAWAPATGQQRPLRPGSACMKLSDALGGE